MHITYVLEKQSCILIGFRSMHPMLCSVGEPMYQRFSDLDIFLDLDISLTIYHMHASF